MTDERNIPSRKVSPVAWVPTLYFAMGMPFVVLNMVCTLMYKGMGVSDAQIAFWTSLIMLPWTLKPLWSPFLEMYKTKKFFVVLTQLVSGIGFALVAFALHLPDFFAISIAILAVIALSGATHDIAADGFYMLALDPHEQSLYVGIRSTFYRIATIAGSGLLIMLAGTLETFTRRIAYSWSIAFYVLAAFFIAVTAYHFFHLPRPDCDRTRKAVSARSLWKDIWLTVTSFFRKPQPATCAKSQNYSTLLPDCNTFFQKRVI